MADSQILAGWAFEPFAGLLGGTVLVELIVKLRNKHKLHFVPCLRGDKQFTHFLLRTWVT